MSWDDWRARVVWGEKLVFVLCADNDDEYTAAAAAALTYTGWCSFTSRYRLVLDEFSSRFVRFEFLYAPVLRHFYEKKYYFYSKIRQFFKLFCYPNCFFT